MEEAVAEKTKQKRVRKAPYRKWSDQEQQQLITFLRSNVPIEKPTAQLYYKRFFNDTGIELEWALVRCKTKNLRQIYTKAKAWTNSTGAGTMRDGETTWDVILRMCPAFDKLEEIFGYKEYTVNACVVDTEDGNTFGPISDEDTQSWLIDASATQLDTPATSAQTPATSAQTPATSAQTPATLAQTPRGPTRKGIYSRTALADVLEVYSSLVENRKEKLKADKEFREKKFQLKREQLDFEKEKHLSQEKFKKLELEMKERIALREIESRERVEMQKLKMIP